MNHDRVKPHELLKVNSLPELIFLEKIDLQSQVEAVSRRRVSSPEMFFIKDGQAKLYTNDKEYVLNRGDLVLADEGESLRIQSADGVSCVYHCALTAFQFVSHAPNCFHTESKTTIVKSGKYYNRMESLFTDIFIENKNKSDGIAEAIGANLMLLLIHAQRVANGLDRQPVVSHVSMCRQLRDFIDNHFGSQITLRSLADMFFVSPDYVSHVFKSEIGVSPIHYLIQCRIKEAKRLLLHTNMTLREISTIVGYDNMAHFSALFKKSTGFSPGQYRQSKTEKVE